MSLPPALTRTSFQRDHAFIAPDGHVLAPLISWKNSQAITLISPHMGARFSMYFAHMEAEGEMGAGLPDVQRVAYLLEGALQLDHAGQAPVLEPGGYFYAPPGASYRAQTKKGCRLVIFEKPYVPHPEHPKPSRLIISHEREHSAAPFMGDEAAQLKPLLPDDPAFDMAVNLFTFDPGAQLPFTETHVMEHGLLMVAGGGIYRLANRWYPIQAGDVIWMASYCPQWFGALGKTKSTYLYYKDVNRDALIL